MALRRLTRGRAASTPAHVHPTQDDGVVAGLSEVVGGPVGEHAGPSRWITPIGVLLALTALTFALGLASKTACAADDFADSASGDARLCGSSVADAYLGTGLVELAWPWTDDEQTRARYPIQTPGPAQHQTPNAGVGLWAYATARVTHVLSGSPDLSPRFEAPAESLGVVGDDSHDDLDREITQERLLFTAVNVLGLGVLALLSTLALAAARRRRPWDAAGFAVAPVLLLAGPVSWDLLAVASVAGALWAWSRGRLALAGGLVGLGAAVGVWPVLLLPAAVLVAARRRRLLDLLPSVVTGLAVWALVDAPAFLTGRTAWEGYWSQVTSRGPDRGSLWTILDGTAGVSDSGAFTGAAVMVALWMVAALFVCWTAPAVPRLSQVAFLLVVGVLLLGVAYSPTQALWLLPLAALARPRWRDLLIWQAGEVLFFAMDWWWRGGFLEPGGGGPAGFYWIAIAVRVLCTGWLVGVVVRDVVAPEHDPVLDPLSGSAHETTTRSNAVAV